jgi:putative transposase
MSILDTTTYLNSHLGRHMQAVSRVVVVAIGTDALGYLEMLSISVGDSEAEDFGGQFLATL